MAEYRSKYTGAEVDALLDKIAEDNIGDIDSSLSTESENPVMNKVITAEFESVHTELDSQNELIEDLQNTKIDKEADDYYPQLAVGLADNLAGVDVVDSEVNFRRSGGGAISDGVARIEAIKGNSVVWNQLCTRGEVKNGTSNGISYSVNANGVFSLNGQTSDNYAFTLSEYVVNYIAGHKYILLGKETDVVKLQIFLQQDNVSSAMVGNGIFTCNNTITASGMPRYRVNPNSSVENFEGIPSLIDLTKMFGVGNEPTTIEEFYSRIPMGIDEYAYNEGEVIHMDVQSIESQGVNAWDEEWELGRLSTVNGAPVNSTTCIRSVNYIKVLPNMQYHATYTGTALYIFLYDAEFKYINHKGLYAGYPVTLPANAAYGKVYIEGTTYNHDICINITDTSINGKYFPYVKRTEDLSIIRKYFPNGMKSAGTAHDEIRYNKATQKWEMVQRIGEVDMGSLAWGKSGSGTYTVYSQSLAASIKKETRNLFTKNLIQGVVSGENTGFIRSDTNGTIYASLAPYTDAESFKAAMTRVILYYELAEPIVTELDAEDQFRDLDYQVWNCGTEKAIAEGISAPLAADITYGFNAIGKIKELESLVAALRAKVGI